METQSMTDALPELSQPAPKRILPHANLEAIMQKPLPTTPQRTETVNVAHDGATEPAVTALPRIMSSKPDDALKPQKRKSSGELADGDARSLPKTKADVVAEARSKKGPKSITRSVFAETAVMQWMDGVDINGQRSPERNSAAGPSSPSKSSSHAAVVLGMLDQNRENIAHAAAKLCTATTSQQGPPMPVPEREASARRSKRDSSMTATSFTPSIFSRTSSWTDHTFLTTPSEMVANNVQSKRTSRDSRDSWRYTRSFASPRSSVMSYSSIPFRSRPFKAEDFGAGPEDSSNNNSPTDPTQSAKDPMNDESRFSRDSASFSRGSYPGSEHLSVSFPRPLSLSPVEENPEIRVTSAMDIDKRSVMGLQDKMDDSKDEKASISANTLDMRGTIASTSDSMDVIAKRSGRFCRGAFSPGMPTEIFGYHTLDFSASTRLSEETAQQVAVGVAKREEEKVEQPPAPKPKTLEHRRSSSSDVLSAHQKSPTLPAPPAVEPATATVRQQAVVKSNSVSSSEASLSPTESEFGEGSSGITDYTDDDIYNLSDAPGIGRVLQIALANIRRDVVKLVVQELNGISTHAHESNAYGNTAGGQLPTQGMPTAGPSGENGGSFGGNAGANKRGARDRGEDNHEDREEGDPGKRRKLNTGAIHSSILRSRFACPFYKRNPDNHQRWRSCRGPGWEEVRRVK
jgi:hypothetical protein